MIRIEFDRGSAIAVGLMSGTSLDGVDAAVVRIEGCGLSAKAELLHARSFPYGDALRERLKDLCVPERSRVDDICGMNALLAEMFAEAARQAVSEAGLSMQDVDFASSHGQTIWHIPEHGPGERDLESRDPARFRSTLQIGDLSVLSKRLGVPVVGDFRPGDMAAGGQGAPLAPYGDLILFRDEKRGRLLQNIGGIGNCTALPAGAEPEDVFAFDTGPGNMVIDQAAWLLSGGKMTYDDGGAWASSGTPCEALVDKMLEHPYFRQAPPKSTGREVFGKAYTQAFVELAREGFRLGDADIVASATLFTARSIAESCRNFVFPRCRIDEVIVSGGGARNAELMRMLALLLPEQRVCSSNAFGVDDEAKEAVIFALLGNDFLRGVPNHLPSATGASVATVLGKLALP
ncbi:anhydro-N-acetylmuramic acid kinase [Saccharibacillus endophyticus]|uniref:Anhydro-N-acetylmuramic acid kinase n=1 Tax=Saccharibacillus endophyticus TaxID=2060666 RepID=A0ABQ1ZXY3_9BACL|nr:anhydro-N-acetylmuramic acid kinase [Saccharibacillus endophyticus]GGH82164.1 anhydro-N-acetylmuramic acid kinase [Saccharibacillus endophyticus]